MRFAILTIMAVGYLGVAAVAQPAKGPPAEDACCCCDINRAKIACTFKIKKADCVCADVMCPKNAPTVFDDLPSATRPGVMHQATARAPPPPPPNGGANAAHTPVPIPATQVPHRMPSKEQPGSSPPGCVPPPRDPSRLSPCCCCNMDTKKVVCEMRDEDEGCRCPKVKCPKAAPTVFVERPTCTSS